MRQVIYCWCASNAQNYSCRLVDCVGLNSTMHWASRCYCFNYIPHESHSTESLWKFYEYRRREQTNLIHKISSYLISLTSVLILTNVRMRTRWHGRKSCRRLYKILSIALIKNNFDWIVTLDVAALPRNIVRINSFATSELGHMFLFFFLCPIETPIPHKPARLASIELCQ